MDTGETQPSLVGNRVVLVGAVLYLLEWVAILSSQVAAPIGAEATRSQLLDTYSGHEDALGWAAGWFSVVLLGRILIVVGLRAALAGAGPRQPLLDFAVAAMAVGVVMEIASYAIVAGAAWAGSEGATAGQLAVADSVAYAVNGMLWGPTGVAIACSSVAMWRSQQFPRSLVIVGVVGGCLMALLGAAFVAPGYGEVAAVLMVAPLLFWVWMLWAGVLLWRRTDKPVPVPV